MEDKRKNYWVLLIAVSCVSTAAIFIKLAEAPALTTAFYRLFFSSLFLLPFILKKGFAWTKELNKKEFSLLILSGIFLGFHFAFWISSLKFTSVASSVVIVTTQPVFVAMFSHFLLKEKVSLGFGLALLLALAGTVVISGGDFKISSVALKGDIFALIGAIMAASYMTIGRNLRKKLDLLPYIFVVYTVAGLVLGLITLILNVTFNPHTSKNLILFILLALIPNIIGHSLYNWSLKYLKAYLVSITILGEPIGASFLAFLIFKEVPGQNVWIGAGLIFLGIWLCFRSGKKLS
jgi:drug/metabolite transporter (DMT)-like permease